jgi:uncharacterized membrane protein YjgN (DUF898 family)
MGGGRYEPSVWEGVIIQILCFILLIILPIIWVAIILFGLAIMLRSPSNALERAKNTADSLAMVTMVPFVFTWIHCGLLFGRSVGDDEDEDEDVRVDLKGRSVRIQS